MENYLPFLVPVYSAFILIACCTGCGYGRLQRRISYLERRCQNLEIAQEQRITIIPQAPQAPPPAPPVLMPVPSARQQPHVVYYPTPGMYPTRGAYQPPQPSAPQDPVPIYQSAPKHI